ncbi:phytase [Kordiimonas lacus]|uniref:3-phytase n=1 Tax=Kordiimonas lacus TaxID=637679 RepID=A0A1G7D6H8_9PROT|nr:phytase [Kordiimonas lacus]SDE46600.1 3-phytase [Kordiimonas lacus]
MKKTSYLAVILATGIVACSPSSSSDEAATNTPSQKNVTVALETTPSTSDSAAAAILWPGAEGTPTYLVGAVEDGIELYNLDGQRLSKVGGGEIESISRLSGAGNKGRGYLLALDTASSSLDAYRVQDGRINLTQSGVATSSQLLEGMCSFRSPLDGQSYAFLLASSGQIEQWHLYSGKDGTLKSRLIRSLQVGTEPKFCVADERSNSLYVTEEAVGVWRFDADVEADTIPELVDVKKFGHFNGEVGGLALHHTDADQTLLLASDVETSRINLYDTNDDHRFIGSAVFAASSTSDGVENAGALFASGDTGGLLVLADEDNGDDATNFKVARFNDIASAFDLSATLVSADRNDPTAAFALVNASVETSPVADGGDAADDPAIWVHPSDPEKSLIIGTNKQGGLYVYNLDGSTRQYLPDGKVNNVDIRYGVQIGDRVITLVAASNRTDENISIYEMDETEGMLRNIADGVQPTGMPDPYGMCLYQSPKDGQTYVFINEKDGLVRQWVLTEGAPGRVKATPVREFTVGSTAEGCVADDDTGMLFVAEEDVALWKYGAEPDAGNTREKVTDPQVNPALKDDLEGVSIYYGEGTSGYIVLSSQGNNSYALFDRQAPHAYVGSFRVIADSDTGIDGSSETDGLDIISTPLGPDFPYGVFVAQDGRNIAPAENQNFKLVPWERIATPLGLETYTKRPRNH